MARPIEGLRIRVRGAYAAGEIRSDGDTLKLEDYASAGGFTEFSIPRLETYAVIDLR